MTGQNGDVSDLPRKALSRTAKLASLPLGAAGRATVGLGKRIGGAPAEAVMAEFQRRTADQLFSVLGELKGGAMKFGQMLSMMESAMPEEFAAPYRATLTKLQDSAPPMPASTVHTILSRELGKRWRDRFEEFDDLPAAAASIGQVHRGILKDGREVAIKLQYPGAAEALRADLRQLGRFARTFGSLFPGLDMKPLVAELQERIGEELDYDREAQAQQQYADAFKDHDEFVVPRVIKHSPTVIVSEWIEGKPLSKVITDGTKQERDEIGLKYVRFMFSGPRYAGLLHSDPHPGNFRVMPDGRLGVVDFGLCARLPDGLPPAIGRLLRISLEGDGAAVLAGLRQEGFIKPRMDIDPDQLMEYLAPFAEPARGDTFQFSRTWMREQTSRTSDFRSPNATLGLKINLPPSYLLIHRVWIGGIAVLSQLDTEAPFRSVLQELLPGFADD
ncbi:putative unusual protein kinase regulating ubiquinone biosynthesis (AarF/ABC1/UbiB family) [Kribbella voronezhensis]|uniref:Putative unusual protein kinase regulating ubiquinone biosynthesis (AarF/ABC1/UbiB family) n=1 Tax=Kribbella voronezhensis TaxID=2512212 RepID=A0A4R7TH60_9ACTN|nr:putative unusual protein kinase regulating ubiquinone biosynthesis (AarF/ABC1/UbiB family) [Kribbella voronezhensis]